MKKVLLLVIFINTLFSQAIDTDKSHVHFTVRNMGIRDVTGTITGMRGTAIFNINNLDSSYFDVTVDINTINTNNEKRDSHLKNEDFFETNEWPTIRFRSIKLRSKENLYGVMGFLTIKDVMKQVFVPFKIKETEKSIIIQGGKTINRLDYNVGVDTNTLIIGNEIKVEVTCVVIKDE